MLRRFIVPIIAFVLPFVLFALYRFLRGRKIEQNWPLAVLFVAGAVLAVQTFALAALTEPKATVRQSNVEDTRP